MFAYNDSDWTQGWMAAFDGFTVFYRQGYLYMFSLLQCKLVSQWSRQSTRCSALRWVRPQFQCCRLNRQWLSCLVSRIVVVVYLTGRSCATLNITRINIVIMNVQSRLLRVNVVAKVRFNLTDLVLRFIKFIQPHFFRAQWSIQFVPFINSLSVLRPRSSDSIMTSAERILANHPRQRTIFHLGLDVTRSAAHLVTLRVRLGLKSRGVLSVIFRDW